MDDMSFQLTRPLPIALSGVGGASAGWLISQSAIWGIIGAVVGLGIAVMILVFQVRPIVAAPVGIGAGIGAYLGGTIVGVLCEPSGCPAFETAAATATGIGSLVGIGLVVALATRSFDEYQEAVKRGSPPPTTGCGTGDRPDQTDENSNDTL